MSLPPTVFQKSKEKLLEKQVLKIEQNKISDYYRCIYQCNQINKYDLRQSDSLLEAVDWWLSEVMNLSKVSDTIGLNDGVQVFLPNVSSGIKQILLILTKCLRSQPGDTIILEHPEIYLHPSAQSRLADFFICMAKSKKNLIIETHSEYLINRFLLRIAQEDDAKIRELFNLLFVSFDKKLQTSVAKPIFINQFGEIENWPVFFFDRGDALELMAATLKNRSSKLKQ